MKHYHFLFFGLIFFCHYVYASDTITFVNFSNQYALTQKDNAYQLDSGPSNLLLSNRIIVKAPLALGKDALAATHKEIHKVVELYQGENFHYLMLEISGIDALATVLSSLKQNPQILLFQPDVLQQQPGKTARRKRAAAVTATQKLEEPQIYRKQAKPENRTRALSIQNKPIRIAIIDDGFDLTHPEFAHTKVAFQYDTESRTLDASPKNSLDNHGTRIAGVIFATVNGNQVEGLVPDAELIAIRQSNTWTSQTLLAFQVAKLAGADIINCSWHSQWLLEPISDVVRDLALHGRDGKGMAVVFAAGNEGLELTAGLHEAALPEAIVVGAYNAKGQRAGYSNWGESVDVFFSGQACLSTAQSGRFAKVNGTSLAAARASGFIAKLLFADPMLSLDELEAQLKTN